MMSDQTQQPNCNGTQTRNNNNRGTTGERQQKQLLRRGGVGLNYLRHRNHTLNSDAVQNYTYVFCPRTVLYLINETSHLNINDYKKVFGPIKLV